MSKPPRLLQELYRRHVPFDPAKPEHRAAYWRLRTTGRQDAELRFLQEAGYSNVLTMMQVRIADHYSQPLAEGYSDAFVLARAAERRREKK